MRFGRGRWYWDCTRPNIGGAIAVMKPHGTAPKYAGQDKVNPGSIILSAEMMLRDMGLDTGRRPDHQGACQGD